MPIVTPTLRTLPKREDVSVPRSQAERLWLIGGGLVAVILVLIGYFFFISPQRSQTANVDHQVATTQEQNAKLQARLSTLRAQNKNLAKYRTDLAKARLALPATTGISDFLRTLQSLGGSTHTDVTALTVGQPAAVVAAAAPATGGTPSSSTASATAPTTAGAPVAAATLFSLSLSATVTGSIGALNDFLEQLQHVQPRAVLITQVTEGSATGAAGSAPSPNSGTLQLSMQAFVAPVAQSAAASPTATPSK